MRKWWIGLLVILAGCAYNPPRQQSRLTACKSNCKNIATALEMYASDNAGIYPTGLAKLPAGNYLKVIPTCPAAEKDTYSSSYQVEVAKRDRAGKIVSGKDHFGFCCSGDNHKQSLVDRGYNGPTQNIPSYDSDKGLSGGL